MPKQPEDGELFNLSGVDDILNNEGKVPQSSTIKLVDASSETALVLVPNMGSDKNMLEDGKVDWRRFTHLDPIDPIWMTYLLLIPKERGGNFTKQFVEQYGNLAYSVGGRHKKLIVDFQRAVSGDNKESSQPKKKRSLTDRLLGRNKEDED